MPNFNVLKPNENKKLEKIGAPESDCAWIMFGSGLFFNVSFNFLVFLISFCKLLVKANDFFFTISQSLLLHVVALRRT